MWPGTRGQSLHKPAGGLAGRPGLPPPRQPVRKALRDRAVEQETMTDSRIGQASNTLPKPRNAFRWSRAFSKRIIHCSFSLSGCRAVDGPLPATASPTRNPNSRRLRHRHQLPSSNFESGNQTGGVVVLDRLKIGGRQVKLAQRLVLVGWKVWIVGAVGNLRHRYELEQRSHRRYRGGVGRVIVLPRQLGEDTVRRKLLQFRTAAIEGLDSSGHHRSRSARVREQPLDIAIAGERSGQQEARHRSRRVMRNLDHGGGRANPQSPAPRAPRRAATTTTSTPPFLPSAPPLHT